MTPYLYLVSLKSEFARSFCNKCFIFFSAPMVNVPAIVGGAVGGVIGLVAIIIVVVCVIRRFRRRYRTMIFDEYHVFSTRN